MNKHESDSAPEALEALDDLFLRARLARDDWKNDLLFVPDEQVFRMFRRARRAGNKSRVALLSEAFSRRLLARARGFALKSGIYPKLIDDLKRASHEIASELWESLLGSDADAAHAERAFGQLFERRAISFWRELVSKKRAMQSNLESLEDDFGGDSTDIAAHTIEELQNHESPDIIAARREEFSLVNGRLQEILTQNEYTTYILLNIEDWQVQEIAAALGVTVKSINNYKNKALAKISKEFKK